MYRALGFCLFCLVISSGFLLSCSMTGVSPVHNSASTTPAKQPNNKQFGEKGNDNDMSNQLDPLLLEELGKQHDVVRTFAWCGSESKGRVMWVDSKGHLESVSFTKNATGYQFTDVQESQPRPFTTVLDQKELASVSEYLSNDEFPVKADTLELADCKARVILLWRAERDSLNDRDNMCDLARPGLRIIVSRGTTVVSNVTYDLKYSAPHQILVDDVNGDGIKDYVFIGHSSPVIYLWTLRSSCVFEPLMFIEDSDGAKERSEFLEGRGIKVRKEQNATYSILVWSKVPFRAEYAEHLFRWDQAVGAFIEKKSRQKKE